MVESCLEYEIINLSPLSAHLKVELALRNPECKIQKFRN